MQNLTKMTQKNPLMKKVRISIRRSIKFNLMALILFNFSVLVDAQSFYNGSSAASGNIYPLSSTTNKVSWIYGPKVFNSAGTTGTAAPSGSISKVYFRLGSTVSGSASYTDYTISLAQNQSTNTAWTSTTFATGLTTVFYSSTFSMTGATANSWYGISLNTPFNYDPTLALVFELKVSAGTGNQILQATASGTTRNYGTYAGSSGSIDNQLIDFGFDIKASKNDLSNLGITGLTNACGTSSDPVFIQIKNTGVVDIPTGKNIAAKTVVTGVGSATFNKVYNRALKVGSTDTIHMGYLNTASYTGAISLKSWYTFALDSIPANDTNVTSKTFTGFVKPTPSFTFTTVCDTVKFTNATKDPCGAVTSYKWDFENGKISNVVSPKYSYPSPGTYNVKLLVFYGTGSKDSFTKQVIVYPKPQANFYATNQCLGTAIDFSNFSYGTNSYKWSFGDATTSTLTSPSRTYTAAGTYAVKVVATNSNSCRDSITKNVIVYSKPVASFSVTNACAGNNAYFNNTTSGGSTYSWDLGDGTSSSFFNPFKIYNVAGTYGIILTVTSTTGCTDKTSGSVVIYSLPVSSFTAKDNCKGTPTAFTNTATGGNTYLWTFGDSKSSSSFSPTNMYTNAGSYNVTLLTTSTTGCNHSYSKTVNINSIPRANFSAKDVCIGVQTDFTNQSTMPSGGGDYIWRFGNGSTSVSANPSYLYSSAGSYDVHLVAISSFGCKDSAITTVSVFGKPQPSFTAVDVCDGKAVQFINTSSGIVSQSWDFGDGAKDNSYSPLHSYSGPSTYKVVLNVTSADNCKELFEGKVTVNAIPELVFFTTDHCLGTVATFANQSTGASSYTWKFGDGDSTKTTQPSHTYLSAGSYSVKLKGISSKGCTIEQTKSIKVFARPKTAFSAPTVCNGVITQFANTSSGAVNYSWNFGDGGGSSTASNTSYQYLNSGNYKVILTATSTDNCKEELSKIINVASLPVPIFLVQDACEGVAVNPSNASQGSITSQKWIFGDGNTDTSKSPSHIYANAGIYKIKLTLTSGLGCTDSTSKTILIYTKPVIKISKDVTISKGHSTQLLASGGNDYLWNPAGTLDNPLSASPTATPLADTRYTVKVMNAFGCFDSASVNVAFIEDFAIEPQNLISPNSNGQNDVWKIKGIEFYPLAKVMIFDQWGRIILEQTDYKNNWDGTMKGKPLSDGTYFYVITLPGSERQYKGTINILRN